MSSILTLLVLITIPAARAADYDGDGIDDLVVGVPHEGLDGLTEVGAIEVIRGSSSGLTSTGDAFVHQDTAGVSASNASDDLFGHALGAGDFDGDGVIDVIVGAPHEPVRATSCGAIWRLELEPARSSLAVVESQLFSQYTAGVADTCEEYDSFGAAVAVADFDGDGYDDVAVGVPGENFSGAIDAGAVHYLRGGSTGLTTSGQAYFYQDVTDVADDSEIYDEFGAVLAAGDFDADGYADLAVGVPGEDWTGADEGAVHILYGDRTGPDNARDVLLTAGVRPMAGTLGDDSECGGALAVGDFDGDGYDDLAIGCPYDSSSGAPAGSVLVAYGSADGLYDSESWSPPVPRTGPAPSDWFGRALTSGDFDGDGYDDLAVGAPLEVTGMHMRTGNGVVHVLRGTSAGLTDVDEVELAQDFGSEVFGSPDSLWPTALTSGDYDDDGYDDLAVGASTDDDAGAVGAGFVNVFYGGHSGPSTTDDQMFHQDVSGIEDTVESSDWFGYSLR